MDNDAKNIKNELQKLKAEIDKKDSGVGCALMILMVAFGYIVGMLVHILDNRIGRLEKRTGVERPAEDPPFAPWRWEEWSRESLDEVKPLDNAKTKK